jgi:hypothetical protein
MGPAIDNIDSDENEDDLLENQLQSTPLMQQINQSKLKVTAHVIGVIKKFSKTYGGSILDLNQMTDGT